MPMSDSYDAISRGVAQGIVCPVESLQGWKLGEVIKYTTQDFGAAYSVTFFVVMNKTRWDSLPADVQKAIEQVSAEWIDKTGTAWDEMDKAGSTFAAGLGDTVIALSAHGGRALGEGRRAAVRRVREGEDREGPARRPRPSPGSARA